MKIAFDVAYIQKQRAGLGRFAAEILRAVLSAGGPEEFILHGWSFSLDNEEIRRLGGKGVTYKISNLPGFLKRVYWNRLSLPALEMLIGSFDIFHSMDPFLPPLRHSKGIATVHDLALLKYPEFFDRSVLKWQNDIRRSLDRAAAILVPSDQTRDDVLEAYHLDAKKIHRIHVPVNPLFTRIPDPQVDDNTRKTYGISYPFLLFAGTFEPRKNITSLVRAFRLVTQSVALPVHLVLAGKKGWLYEDIFRTIESSEVRNRIHVLEFVSDHALASLYRQADVFVYPSLYEGHGSPVAEAFASGVPVVTSKTSSLRELASGAAELIDPGSVEDIAGAVVDVLADQTKRIKMIESGLARARMYSYEIAAGEVFRAYRAV